MHIKAPMFVGHYCSTTLTLICRWSIRCYASYGWYASSKRTLKKTLCNGKLYRPAGRNIEHGRNFYWSLHSSLKHLIQIFVHFLGFSWMERWLNDWKLGDSCILMGLSEAAFYFFFFFNVTKLRTPNCPTKLGSTQTMTARWGRKQSQKKVAQRSWRHFFKV